MSGYKCLLEYKGHIDYIKIDSLLKNLKQNRAYKALKKTLSKRLYSIIVECLENIAKHSADAKNDTELPYINVLHDREKIIIRTGNPVAGIKVKNISALVDLVNELKEKELFSLYESKINISHKSASEGAGLGFMLMKLKSGNNIDYSFKDIDDLNKFFESEVTLKINAMRKLIIDQTSHSPKVVLDPDINWYEISGESRPPDVAGFYSDILNWIDDYSGYLLKSSEEKPMVINLDLEYFNSSSAKYILDFCKKIAFMRSKGKDITVKWHYEVDDPDMLETGREMSKMSRFPFEYTLREKR